MKPCTEFAVFQVAEKNIDRAVVLSHSIFAEMNSVEKVITTYQILQKTDKPNEICWHLVWVNDEVAKTTTAKWPSFQNTTEFQSLIEKDLYYGHFVEVL